MSLDAMVGALIAAINANTDALQAGHAAAPQQAMQAAPPQQFVQPQAPPQHFVPPTGMPGAPFPSAAPQQAPRPFNDAQGLLAWAKAKYDAKPTIASALESILKAHGLGDITSAQPTQFDSLYTAINAL